MTFWTRSSFLCHELLANNHLSAIDAYVLSLANRGVRHDYLQFVFKNVVFDMTEIASRRAWSILERARCHQIHIPSSVKRTEFLNNKFVLTTAPDWAAKKGHLELLKWLLANTDEGCTTYAMDFAARYGHINILEYLHREGHVCTNAAADWAVQEGHAHVLTWLYDNTHAKCSEYAMPSAARRGDLRMLKWLHTRGAGVGYAMPSSMNAAIALGYSECVDWLQSIGANTDCDADTIQRIRAARSCEDPWDY